MKKITLLFLLITWQLTAQQRPLGIDVSHYQGNIDWNMVYQAGKVFAFVKATEGYTYDDPMFVQNMERGTRAGVLMGAYHFARPDNNTPEDEAEHFVRVAGPYIGSGYLPPVLDLEDPPGRDLQSMYSSAQLSDWVRRWLQRVEQLTGVEPIIYTNGRYTRFLDPSLTVYKLWIAEPDGNTDEPDNLGHWTTWAFKQYSWTGNVPGIAGDVDLDVFNGTMEELQALADYEPPLNCNLAVPLECGDLYHGPASDSASRVQWYACNPVYHPGPERLHKFTGRGPGTVEFILSGYTGELEVMVMEECDSVSCAGVLYPSSARASLRFLQNVSYVVIVDSRDGSGSAYDLATACYFTGFPGDWSLNNLKASADTLTAGQGVQLEVNLYYAGDDNGLPPVETAFYLSDTPDLSGNIVELARIEAVADSSHRMPRLVTGAVIPATLPEGDYYLVARADDPDSFAEAFETNNVMAVPVRIRAALHVSGPDLSDVRIYPNPTDGRIRISGLPQGQWRVSVYDISGKLLLQTDYRPGLTPDLSAFKPGIYLLTVDNGRVRRTFKVVRN